MLIYFILIYIRLIKRKRIFIKFINKLIKTLFDFLFFLLICFGFK
nr:MAG TPA: hypothetical protein [Caudoviricetes sp.]